MKRLSVIFIIITFLAVAATIGQTYRITGKIVEKEDSLPIAGASILLINAEDSTEIYNGLTNVNGIFFIRVKHNSYFVKVSFIGFQAQYRDINVKDSDQDLGLIFMKKRIENIKEVVVIGHTIPVSQKGDTTEMSAGAYKVHRDADAQDLVQKMPGITVENGKVKAHGEEVKRVLVDGKNFLGEDPSLALQTLPAEVVDKVQVYNKMSEQAEFTKFDDGQSEKVMNIITREDKRKGTNGKFTTGHGNGNKYNLNGRLGIFNDQQRLTLIGGSNNVNQQNFSTQDLLGAMGRNRGEGRPFLGFMGGINTIHVAGINYTGYINKKVTVSGSYFFNIQDNYTEQLNNLQFIGISDTITQAQFQKKNSSSTSKNYNHRFDTRLEYLIDSSNSVILSPRFSFQQNTDVQGADLLKYNNIKSPLLSSSSNSTNDGLGYNYSNEIIFRHKFRKKGRTVSLGFNVSGNYRKNDNVNLSNDISISDSISKNQKNWSKTQENKVFSNLVYTEPLGTYSAVMLSYTTSFTNSNSTRNVYDRTIVPPLKLDSISNACNSNYNIQRTGIGYMIRNTDIIRATIGVEYQYAKLLLNQPYARITNIDRPYNDILPNAMLSMKFSKNTSLMFFYRTSTNPPAASQMQDVVDVSNSINFVEGNPELKPQYTQFAHFNFRHSNPEKFTNFNVNFLCTYNMNPMGNSIYIVTKDTIIKGQTLLQNGQLTLPVNMKNSWMTHIFTNYSFLFQPIKCNLTFLGGAGYITNPGYVNQILSITKSYELTGGLVIVSNMDQNIDFTGSYNLNYTLSQNTTRSSLNSRTWYQSLNLKSNLTFLKGMIFQNNLTEQINRGLTLGYNQNYLRWDISLGKKIFKNNSGQITFNVFDVLNQNKNISRTVSEFSITDNRTNTIGRFFLFSFNYTIKSYQGTSADDYDKKSKHNNEFYGPPPPPERGIRPGPEGPPPGMSN